VDLASKRGGDTLIFVLGATYLDALADDVHRALAIGADDRVSIISAGAENIEGLVPVDTRFRAVVGGTDVALNARTLEWLADRSASECEPESPSTPNSDVRFRPDDRLGDRTHTTHRSTYQ
jgi:hypothetical protein